MAPTPTTWRCSLSTRARTARWFRWTSWKPTPATGCRCASPGVTSGGWTPTARSRGPSPSASATSPARHWWPTTSSRPTGRPTPTTAPTSSSTSCCSDHRRLAT
uniref:Uncharacterized protein n=1 Tax=Arundo donax TaxID=35708 RepID=A0A0A9DN24_ARUDO